MINNEKLYADPIAERYTVTNKYLKYEIKGEKT